MKTSTKTVTILGSTGSVGRSAVDLIFGHRDKFRVRVLTANKNVKLLADQARNLHAEVAVIADKTLYSDLKKALEGTSTRAEAGYGAVVSAAGLQVDWVLAAIVGAAGIKATLEAIRQGTTVALANKESLVCAGSFMMDAVRKYRATLLPVDSEHNAIFQVMNEKQREQIKRIILTASGGPFLRRTREELRDVTPEQAMKHPTWSMGSKISVDCATMMNKSLEIIEASYLFQLEPKKIDVLIHPQSIVHSMVEYIDGSVLSQMGAPDMRTPIAHTLTWPDRIKTTGDTLNLSNSFSLSFEPVDMERFPALKMAQQILQAESGASVVFNAANEVAVEAFLSCRLNFSEIERIVEEVLQIVPVQSISGLQDVFQLDIDARRIAEKVVTGVD
ncbi:MAG: 1-deoxy-D-xylulose-5-phosphate reductoisomerase [Alphaproteobacteria bacterium]|nr:1-deoxy-D-xylulose-5-phosphate reductoisomerase [Alphaproteobacteria bacterium]